MKCIITYTEQTIDEPFYAEGADATMLDFSAGPSIDEIFEDGASGVKAELLMGIRDAKK